MKRYFLEVIYGFVATVVLAVLPPIAFLAMPAAGFFLFVVPFWSIGVVCLLFFGLLIFGRIPAAIGVAMFAIAVALSPVGRATAALITAIEKNTQVSAQSHDLIQRKLRECATTGYVPLKKPSARHKLLILDGINTRGEQNYDVSDAVAVLTGMRVIEIGRVGTDRHFDEAWETSAEHSSSCVGERDSAKVGITPRGSQRMIAPLAVDLCLRRTKTRTPPRDQTPAIIVRSVPVTVYCKATEVIERTESGDVGLGRIHYNSLHQRYYPEMAVPEGIPPNNWLNVLLSEVLQQNLGDKALMKRAITAKQ